ncbi:hypothetical protein QCA50_010140 [Cerrena zonata]|uniref:AB hydrolase-1 domain-containing protein n=1 Tax=Cerrena zonata TaxID=2478898 RepID=A0AAW0G5W1_9APHY
MKGYGEALRYFLESELVAGHTIVAIGHSASTAAWTLGCSFYSSVSFRAVIFIESTLDSIKSMSLDDSSINQYLLKLQGTLLRKDAWDDISSLSQWLRKQYPWKLWDQRVLDIYLKHGFKTVVRGEKQVIMPKISKMQEVGAYLYQDHIVALEQLSKLCSKFPVHSVFVQRSELISKRARAVLCDKSEGRNMASVMILPKVGHWCVQEKPELVAEAIFGILNAPVAESRL